MKIAIIGCGNMGTGLAEQLSPHHQLFLHDRNWSRTQQLAERVKGTALQDPGIAVEEAQLIILAVKPQNLKELSEKIAPHMKQDQIVASLLAGIPLSALRKHLPGPIIVRMMPNLALRTGMGVMGMVDAPDIPTKLKDELTELLAPLGLVYWLKESQVDALTSLTGSGPAFLFAFIESMIHAGTAMGFQENEAQNLVLQTLKGCLALLQNTGNDPGKLVQQIASPNGTTIAGLKVMEKENIKGVMIKTFLAALHRAQEMAKSQE